VFGWRGIEVVNRPRTDYDRVEKKIKRRSAKGGKIVKTPVPKLVSDALDVLFPHDATTLLVNHAEFSDEAAQSNRDDSARDSEMMSPGVPG
jgi:hypothetical protein